MMQDITLVGTKFTRSGVKKIDVYRKSDGMTLIVRFASSPSVKAMVWESELNPIEWIRLNNFCGKNQWKSGL